MSIGYKGMDVKDKAMVLIPLLSMDRSRDMGQFLNVGRIICNILGCGDDSLSMWKGVTVEQRHSLCDEYWKPICEDYSQPMKTVRYILSSMAEIGAVDLDDMGSVTSALERLSKEYSRVRAEVDGIGRCTSVEELLGKRMDIRAFSKYTYGIDILQYLAKKDSPVRFIEMVRSYGQVPETTNRFGTREWGSVRRAIMEGSPMTSSVEDILNLLRSSVANVLRGNGRFVLNEKGCIEAHSESEFFKMCRNTRVLALCTEKKEVSLHDIVHTHITHLLYDSMVYHPGSTPDKVLNLFRGYAANTVDVIDGEIQVILDHLRVIQCNGDESLYQYLLNWLSFVVQNSSKPGTAILMIGRQGVGKSIFWEFFSRDVVGRDNTYTCSTLDEITGRFNAHIANKRLLLISECKGASKHNHDKLKAMVTDPTISIEMKQVTPIQLLSSHCVAITSNHRDHHFVDSDDRRFVVIECSGEKKDGDYFDHLDRVMTTHANSFYTYLMERDISTFRPTVFPKSQLRVEMEEDNGDPVHTFISQNRWEGWRGATEVYREYERWSNQRKLKPVPLNRFRLRCGPLIDIKLTKKGTTYMVTEVAQNADISRLR